MPTAHCLAVLELPSEVCQMIWYSLLVEGVAIFHQFVVIGMVPRLYTDSLGWCTGELNTVLVNCISSDCSRFRAHALTKLGVCRSTPCHHT
jgi:hypothetical protein